MSVKKAEPRGKNQESRLKVEKMITNFNVGENFWCANKDLGGGMKCMSQCFECGNKNGVRLKGNE